MPETNHPAFSMVAKLELIRAACGLRLPAYESRTLIALASLINDKTGCAYPSHATLAGVVAIDARHVARALRGLEGRKLVLIAEPGTRRRATRYAVDAAAVLAARPASTGVSDPPLQAGQTHLYRWDSAACTGVSDPPLQAGKGQRRESEGQPKRQLKLSASRSALRRRDESASAAAPATPAARPRTKNAWLTKYRPAAD